MIARLGTLLKWIILLPILIAVLLLAVANDQTVTVHLNPFDTSDPVLKIDAPLYQVAFAVFLVGVLVGGLLVWAGRLRHRGAGHHHAAQRSEWDAGRRATPAAAHDDLAPAPAAAFLPRPERR